MARQSFNSVAQPTSRMRPASWLPDFIAGTAIIQPINADIQANAMPASIGGGAVDVSGPMLTSNIAFDQMLETLSLAYGVFPSGNSRADGVAVGSSRNSPKNGAKPTLVFGLGDPTGLILETPLGSKLILSTPAHGGKTPSARQVGCWRSDRIPYSSVANEISRLSAESELSLESPQSAEPPQNGCWHPIGGPDNQFGLAFSAFIPNALYRPVLATNLAIWMLARSRWVARSKVAKRKSQTLVE